MTEVWHLKTALIMVGLPARGKSYIAKKIVAYHRWLGLKAKLFNVGNHRREALTTAKQDADFFSAENQEAKKARENLALKVLDDLLLWLKKGGDVAVFDATNTTNVRRWTVLDKCRKVSEELNVIFVESICDDPKVIRSNCMQKVLNSPDYKNMPIEEALKDLEQRIANYERVYEPIDDNVLSYIKLINLHSKVICNKIYGSIPQATATFLMALNLTERSIWLCRSGKVDGIDDFNKIKASPRTDSDFSEDMPFTPPTVKKQFSKSQHFFTRLQTNDNLNLPKNQTKSLDLSKEGVAFAQRIKEFVSSQLGGLDSLQVYTSTLPRAVQTAKIIRPVSQQWSALNMLDTGLLGGLSIYEIKSQYPSEYDDFMKDRFHFRLPGGESFEDVVHRAEPFIIELERQTKSCLVISHLSTLRVIMAYFLEITPDKLSDIDIPQHTIIQLVPSQYGWIETRFDLTAPAEFNASSSS